MKTLQEVVAAVQEKVGKHYTVTSGDLSLGQWSPIGSVKVKVTPVANDRSDGNAYEVEFGEMANTDDNAVDKAHSTGSINDGLVAEKPAPAPSPAPAKPAAKAAAKAE